MAPKGTCGAHRRARQKLDDFEAMGCHGQDIAEDIEETCDGYSIFQGA